MNKCNQTRVSRGFRGLAKNRQVKVVDSEEFTEEIRLDALAESLPKEAYTQILINLEKARTVWVAILEVEISRLKGKRKIAIVMNARHLENADDIDYFITNVEPSIVTSQSIVDTYSQRNWVERLEPHLVFDREAKGWLGLKEYQTRGIKSLKRHFILVFCAYTFMRTRMARLPRHREMSVLWHKLTGGLRRRWANKPINTFHSRIRSISYSYVRSFCPVAQS